MDYLKKQKSVYRLLGSVCHEGSLKDGSFKVFVHHKGTDKWFEMADLMVREIQKEAEEQLTVSEAYLQVWEQV
jgi:U4/U6.U5 tri-snRNP-associated protein 2